MEREWTAALLTVQAYSFFIGLWSAFHTWSESVGDPPRVIPSSRDGDTETKRARERQKERETETHKDRQREGERDGERERETDRERGSSRFRTELQIWPHERKKPGEAHMERQ